MLAIASALPVDFWIAFSSDRSLVHRYNQQSTFCVMSCESGKNLVCVGSLYVYLENLHYWRVQRWPLLIVTGIAFLDFTLAEIGSEWDRERCAFKWVSSLNGPQCEGNELLLTLKTYSQSNVFVAKCIDVLKVLKWRCECISNLQL
jgi:hypothetical protein